LVNRASNWIYEIIYLTPLIPLFFKGEGEGMEEGLTPLLDSHCCGIVIIKEFLSPDQKIAYLVQLI